MVGSIDETPEANDCLSETSTSCFDLSSTSDEDVFLPAIPTLPVPPWKLKRTGAFRHKDRTFHRSQPPPNPTNNNNLPPIPEHAVPAGLQHINHDPDDHQQREEDEDTPAPTPRRSNRLRKDNSKVKGDSWTC